MGPDEPLDGHILAIADTSVVDLAIQPGGMTPRRLFQNTGAGRWRRLPLGLLAIAGALALALLTGCTTSPEAAATPTSAPVPQLHIPPHVESESLRRLYEIAGSYLETSGDHQQIRFRCTIAEGTFCWFGAGPQDGPVAADLARQVVDQVGVNAIDNANRNEVSIECSRSIGGGSASCKIDWGWGASWEPLPLE